MDEAAGQIRSAALDDWCQVNPDRNLRPIPMTDEPLIAIHNATIYRGDTRVFKDFSLTIHQHEQVAILGPNGSGKTTLLKTLNREIYPVTNDQSWLRILGKDRWNVWDLRAQIGIVSHELQMRYTKTNTGLQVVLSGYLSSIGIHGLLAAHLNKTNTERALEVMRELAIDDLAEKPLGNMSTGQQRRCLLARALVHDPDTLILDEPTAGLDLTSSFDLMGRISGLIKAGKSLLLVTHQLNEIPPDVDRVILLRQGKIIADGKKSNVLTDENLFRAYDTDIRVSKVGGYYLASPGGT
jgi:iron complex transport system ATP-binding protein